MYEGREKLAFEVALEIVELNKAIEREMGRKLVFQPTVLHVTQTWLSRPSFHSSYIGRHLLRCVCFQWLNNAEPDREKERSVCFLFFKSEFCNIAHICHRNLNLEGGH